MPEQLQVRRDVHYERVAGDIENGESDSDEKKKTETKTAPVSLFRLCTLSVANFGISAAWSMMSVVVTPYFSSVLRAGPLISHMVWMCGPVSGLIMAPLVGYLSDRCGRRQPFILAGGLITFVMMFAFASATTITTAIIAFAMLDLAINVTMNPLRALLGDLVPERQQAEMQAATLVAAAAGDFCSNALIGTFESPVLHIRFLFAVHALVYLGTSLVLMAVAKEKKKNMDKKESDKGKKQKSAPVLSQIRSVPQRILRYYRDIPVWLWKVGVVYACAFFAFFCFVPNWSNWLGASVLAGDPRAKVGSPAYMRYQSGTAIMGETGMATSLLGLSLAAAYPALLRRFSAARLVGASFGAYGIVVVLLAGTQNVLLARCIIVAYAIPRVAMATVPAILTVQKSEPENRAKSLGTLAIFCVVPQMIDTLYTGYVSKVAGEAATIRIGACWSIIGSVFALKYLKEM